MTTTEILSYRDFESQKDALERAKRLVLQLYPEFQSYQLDRFTETGFASYINELAETLAEIPSIPPERKEIVGVYVLDLIAFAYVRDVPTFELRKKIKQIIKDIGDFLDPLWP